MVPIVLLRQRSQLKERNHAKDAFHSACFIMLCISGCTAVDPSTIPPAPANYRELILAQAAKNPIKRSIIKAEISAPGIWESPVIPSASRRIVCTRMTIDGTFGEQSFATGYVFSNGQIDDMFYPENVNPAAGGFFGAALLNTATCGKLNYKAFPELAQLNYET